MPDAISAAIIAMHSAVKYTQLMGIAGTFESDAR